VVRVDRIDCPYGRYDESGKLGRRGDRRDRRDDRVRRPPDGAGGAETIAGAFPALYTLGPSLAIGWAIHLFHGAVLGVVFAALVSRPPLGGYVDGIGATLGAGVVYGVVTTVALAWVLLPIWLRVVGFPQAPPLPNVGMSSLVGHLVYGVVLAGVYAGLSDRL
jgi:hypothetical protein